jgi:peptide chain release factor 3
MAAYHPRLEREVRLARAYRIFAREREPVREAFAGDIIGVINPGLFVIGDTVTTGEPAAFIDIPRFPPEHFAVLINQEIVRYKQFHKGLSQLEEEGAVQVMYAEGGARREPILAAVGALQFDVVLARLRYEYGVEARVERLPFTCARWIKGNGGIERMTLGSGVLRCRDHSGQTVVLFASNWHLEYFHKENPDIEIVKVGSPWLTKN